MEQAERIDKLKEDVSALTAMVNKLMSRVRACASCGRYVKGKCEIRNGDQPNALFVCDNHYFRRTM